MYQLRWKEDLQNVATVRRYNKKAEEWKSKRICRRRQTQIPCLHLSDPTPLISDRKPKPNGNPNPAHPVL